MKKNKKVILFLIKFFASYAIMVSLYSFYLSSTQEKGSVYACAPITTTVANQTVSMIELLGFEANLEQSKDELSVRLYVDNQYIARVIEGCNSISVIILFLAFIIAFSGPLKTTLIYGIVGGLLIYLTNIFRMAVIVIGVIKFPAQQETLHSLVFPAIIYGMVFLLWVLWVNKFSTLKKSHD